MNLSVLAKTHQSLLIKKKYASEGIGKGAGQLAA